MKLHLPIVLLTAVYACMMNATAAEYSISRQTGDAYNTTNHEVKYNANDVIVDVTGGDFSKYNMGGTTPSRAEDGCVQGASLSDVMPYDHASIPEYKDIYVNVSGSDTKIKTVVGEGVPCPVKVTGSKNIEITGGDIDLVVGGVYYKSGTHGYTHVGNASYAGTKWSWKDTSDPDINITVSGGTVDQIRGGNHNSSSKVYDAIVEAKKIDSTGAAYETLMADKPWAVAGDISINIKGKDTVVGAGGKAIMGAGGSGHSVDGTVTITIDDGSVNGDVYAGTSNIYTEVKATEININGGTITGNIYGGGNYDDGADKANKYNLDALVAPTVQDDAKVVLNGGTVSQNVYGAGDGDRVAGSTEITIAGKGTAVGGKIFGGGINRSTVVDDRLLKVDSTHKGTQDYKLADFKNIDIAGDLSLTELTVATDDDGTSVNVQKDGSIKTKAGVLTNLNKLNVDGTLNIDMNGTDSTKSAVSGKILTLGDNAVINVQLDGAEAAESIALFGFDDLQDDADDLIITLNGKLVDAALWDFTGGNLVIQEASTTTLNLSRNQSSFYQAVQAAAAANPDNQMLVDLATARDEAAVKAAIDAMSGHEYATAMSSQIEGNLGHLRRLRGAMGKGTALGSYVAAPGSAATLDEKGNEVQAATPAVTDIRNWRVGVSAFHEETEIDSDARGDGYDRSETGAMLTAEYYVNKDVTLGGAISYGRTKLSTDGAKSRHEDNTRFDVYALYGQKRWSFATSLGLGMHEHELLGGDVDGYSINFLQDAAYTVLSREKDNVQVFGTIESSWNEIDSCSNGVVSAGSQDAWATDVTAGVRYNRALRAFGNAPAGVFTAQTGVTASIGDIKSGVDMSLGGYGYRQESATRNRWGWNLGAGVDVPVRTNVSVYGTAEAVLRGDSNSVDGQVGVKVSF